MIIVGMELVLGFPEDARPHTPARRVFQALGGDTEDSTPPREPGASVRDHREKRAVVWNYESFNIVQEDVEDVPKCIAAFLKAVETVNKVAPIGKISEKTLRVSWILPAGDCDFRTLEAKYRQTFIKDIKLFTGCVDSTVVVYMGRAGLRLEHQSGAMDVAQLQKDFRVFKIREAHPGVFMFLATTIVDEELEEYSKGDIKRFLAKAYDLCQTHADEFEHVMEGIA